MAGYGRRALKDGLMGASGAETDGPSQHTAGPKAERAWDWSGNKTGTDRHRAGVGWWRRIGGARSWAAGEHGLRLAVQHADTTTGHRHARPSCLGTTCVSSRHTDRPSPPSPSRSQKKKACGEHDRACVSLARGRVSFKLRRPPGAVYLPAWARGAGRVDCRTVARRAAARAASSGASPAAGKPSAPSGNRAVVWTTRSGSTPTRL